MALSKLNFNSLNLTPVAGKGIGFDSGADDLEASFSGGDMTFIKKLTASSSGDLSFVNGASDVVLDSTYKEYIFIFKNIHPQTDDANFFIKARDGGSNYDATATSTFFIAYNGETNGEYGLQYQTGSDVAQGTSGVRIAEGVGNENDQNVSGFLHLFNPSSTTFVKHFISRVSRMYPGNDSMVDDFSAGYFNVTAAIDAIQFTFNSGNIDAGTITLYGIN